MVSLGEAQASVHRAKLQVFLARNPEADVKAGEPEASVVRPWGEEALEIPLRSDDEELLDALNSVRLPPRFTAIWHDDKREFEVIFTVLEKEDSLLERSFEFRYRGGRYNCAFGPSSSRLRSIARRIRPSGTPSRANYRNLLPLNRFEHTLEAHPDSEFVANSEPVSFWMGGIDEYDDDLIRDLVRNLNFHMSYFDRHTPSILIHEESERTAKVDDSNPPHISLFPDTLSGKDIDQHLLILWESARRGDPFLRFIQYYQILEYAGFYHFKDKVQRDIERALVAPDAVSRPDRVAQQLLDAISTDKRSDIEKINEMVEECVDLHEMWDVLQDSLAAFSEEIELDGGYLLPALVSASAGYEQFEQSWNGKFLPNLHRVRNALVHAREVRQSTMIAPTTANQERLSPWLLPLSQTAARVMLYSRL